MSIRSIIHHRYFPLFVLGLVLIATLLVPDMAFAQESGSQGDRNKYNFVPSDEVQKGFSDSYSGIWKMAAEAGMWGAIIWFLVSILFMKGRYWYIAPIVFLIAFFGEPAVKGGMEKSFGYIQQSEEQHSNRFSYSDYEAKLAKATLDGLA